MSRSSILAILLAAGGVFAGNASAQVFGPWVHAPTAKLDIFVSPSGSNSNLGTSPSAPVQTLAQALINADSLQALTASAPRGVTINVMPGTYTVTAPLSVPAFGVSIEAYWATPGTGAPTVIDSGVAAGRGLFEVDTMVSAAAAATGITANQLPPTSFRGLTIDAGTSVSLNGIWITPGNNLSSQGTQSTISVGVYQCKLLHFNHNILTTSNAAYLELCEFVDNDVEGALNSTGSGIDMLAFGPSSCLVRSNRVRNLSIGIRTINLSAVAASARPRILSNFVSECQTGIEVTISSAQIVNNTLAFNVASAGVPLGAINYTPDVLGSPGETLVVANNLLWNPAISDVQLQGTGPAFAGTLVLESNDFDSGNVFVTPTPTPAPNATNMSISSAKFVSASAPLDLHLTSASPSATSAHIGNFGFVDPATAQSQFAIGSTTIPSDVNLDVDSDARTHQPFGSSTRALHRGADQLVADGLRIAYSTSASPSTSCPDPIGNVIQDSSGNNIAVLSLTGPANAAFSLSLCQQFANGPTMQHTVFNPQGSFSLDTNPSNTATVASGSFSAGGTATVTLNFGNAVSAGFLEAEMYLQLAVLRSDGTASFSNRVRLDIDRN